MARPRPFSVFIFRLPNSRNTGIKNFKTHISSKALAGILEGMEGSTRKRSSRISSGLSLLLDNFQRSFAQDRQLRASKDEDENKDDKETEGDT